MGYDALARPTPEPPLAGVDVEPHVPGVPAPVGDDPANATPALRGAGGPSILKRIREGIAAPITRRTRSLLDSRHPLVKHLLGEHRPSQSATVLQDAQYRPRTRPSRCKAGFPVCVLIASLRLRSAAEQALDAGLTRTLNRLDGDRGRRLPSRRGDPDLAQGRPTIGAGVELVAHQGHRRGVSGGAHLKAHPHAREAILLQPGTHPAIQLLDPRIQLVL
jgi:hypothetical protein